MSTSTIETILERFSRTLPPGAGVLKDDLEQGLRSALHATFARLDLVTREEFEVQARVLARSRSKLEQLERRVAELEARLNN